MTWNHDEDKNLWTLHFPGRLIIRLEEFELEFRSVAEDDGDYFPGGAGYDERKPVCFARELAFRDIHENWASLPGELIFRIQNLPFKQKATERFLSNEHAVEEDFPHQVPYFRERQTRYKELADECDTLITELKTLCRFPEITGEE